MKRAIFLRLLACLPSVALPTAVAAQEVVAAPTPTADALAAQMRLLASNPRDVNAMLTAADLSTRLGDTGAAMALLARAQAADPSNPRILAARANAYVLMERPGEALRLFAQAEGRGVSMTPYLSQRGLAYDLIGQNGYAQRDYRRAQTDGVDDETTRRLALSLGISGRRDEALALLDPLVRSNDRAAWRARACVLALAGDIQGAQTIASAMIPGGGGLTPFFNRLPTLSLANRAFAVHFGAVTASPARLADARLAPPLAPLPVAAAPVTVAAALPVPRTTAPRTASRTSSRGTRPGRQPIETPAYTLTARRVETPKPATPARGENWTTALAPLSVTAAEPVPVTPAAASPAAVVAAPPPQPAPVVTTAPARTIVASPAPAPRASPVRLAAAPIRTAETARRNTALLASIIDTISVPASETSPRATRRTAALPVEAKPTVAPKKKEPVKVATKPVEKKPDPTKTEPERWWVQVAGGANENDLGKAWKAAAAKSAALKGKPAWAAPSRATNRVLSGPFKTQGEAMALVNRLKKDGVSSFAWQSEAGQKVAKLPAK